MSYSDDLTEQKLKSHLLVELKKELAKIKTVKIMEVCGTHTRAIFQSGLHKVLPPNLELVSGPGCPICVTPSNYIQRAVELAQREEVMITSFADLLKVPGGQSSLKEARLLGAEIKVVSSPLTALEIAKQYPAKEIVFLAVGFETTAPVIALSLLQAEAEQVENYSILVGLKTMPALLEELVANKNLTLEGLLCPGHVASIIGVEPFNFLAVDYGLPAAVAGFEGGDILLAVGQLIRMIRQGKAELLNLYPRAVREKGNQQALEVVYKVFEAATSQWRGLGEIADSGLGLKEGYEMFSAAQKFGLSRGQQRINNTNCSCGDILLGLKKPPECDYFGSRCSPNQPLGPCMVSQEGSCAVYYFAARA